MEWLGLSPCFCLELCGWSLLEKYPTIHFLFYSILLFIHFLKFSLFHLNNVSIHFSVGPTLWKFCHFQLLRYPIHLFKTLFCFCLRIFRFPISITTPHNTLLNSIITSMVTSQLCLILVLLLVHIQLKKIVKKQRYWQNLLYIMLDVI